MNPGLVLQSKESNPGAGAMLRRELTNVTLFIRPFFFREVFGEVDGTVNREKESDSIFERKKIPTWSDWSPQARKGCTHDVVNNGRAGSRPGSLSVSFSFNPTTIAVLSFMAFCSGTRSNYTSRFGGQHTQGDALPALSTWQLK